MTRRRSTASAWMALWVVLWALPLWAQQNATAPAPAAAFCG